MESAEEQHDQAQVAREDEGDPAGSKGLQRFDWRRQEGPDSHCDRGIEQVPRQDVAGVLNSRCRMPRGRTGQTNTAGYLTRLNGFQLPRLSRWP
jgi:hypothetical protein